MATRNKFVNVNISWAKNQLQTWMAFIDANPFDKMEDRTKLRPTKGGGTVLEVVSTIEQQQKNIRDMMKDYLELLAVIKKLDTEEDTDTDTGAFRDVKESRRMLKAREDEEDK